MIVFDADTGKYKRHWGAYGHKPTTPTPGHTIPMRRLAQQFRNPVHCADALQRSPALRLRPRERPHPGVQADGTFVKEDLHREEHAGRRLGLGHRLLEGSAAEVLYTSADGANRKVHILQRETLEVLTSFGDGGRQPGEFYGVHSIATDSKGNIYTTETYRGQRVQKFVYKGLAPVTKDQGVVWPKK